MLSKINQEAFVSTFEARQMPPLTLAYIGDCVFDLYVRTHYVTCSKKHAGELHRLCSAQVNARAQAQLASALMPQFSEEEQDVYRRGRNAKSATVPKNMSIADYRAATGMEAVIGFLYLSGQIERASEMLRVMELEEEEA